MSSGGSFAKLSLSYPVYAADFDPYGRGYLIVGGGGGEGRSGVGNKITLLDVSSRAAIENVGELELSRDEDRVSTIANLATKNGIISFAGINSSEQDRKSGKNEHLRSFEISYPPRKRQRISDQSTNGQKREDEPRGELALLAKTALFKPTISASDDMYQRVMRLSPVIQRDTPNKRIAAIASDLAPTNEEIVLFDATTSSPTNSDVISRISLPKNDRVMDVDIGEPEAARYLVAYCTNYSVYVKDLSYDFASKNEATASETNRAYSLPMSARRPKLRALRFLTKDILILLVDLPSSGAELLILRLHGSTNGSVTLRKTLSTKAVGFDICALDADGTTGDRQFVVAVGGSDNSIQILTLDFDGSRESLSTFRKFTVLRDVHPIYITRVCFEPFHSPVRGPASSISGPSNDEATPNNPNPVPLNALPQYLRLASTSAANQVVVDTFPLTPVKPTSRNSRYVLSSQSFLSSLTPFLVIAFVLAVSSILMQSVLDAQGVLEPGSSLLHILPAGARQRFGDALGPAASVISQLNLAGLKARLLPDNPPEPSASDLSDSVAKPKLKHLVEQVSRSDDPTESQAVVVHEHAPEDLSLDVQPDAQAYLASERGAKAKRWEELEPHQQAAWREKLVKAGHWAVDEGDTVLKGILFSEWAGLVGEMAQEAMRN
ncbi:hypothetical protein EV356DRAFT_470919 [Viridothelium virens]|uniref:Guanine nucleotide-exchange factor SEC12 n=1 Tax=Viridothelium virens TaxID=1048519 RepID=A0A6A6H2V0_VIRVR|nr:hypothetical protein EV356DRAFT_470919 [Viridothelium virens]